MNSVYFQMLFCLILVIFQPQAISRTMQKQMLLLLNQKKSKMLKKYKHLSEVLPKHERVIDSSFNRMPHLTYPHETMEMLKIQHFKPQKFVDWAALWTVKWMMTMINLFSGYAFGPVTQNKLITRSLLMETISLIPGMVASIYRYLRSLRLLKPDKGWIHHLLQQSDNQRFHFFTFLRLKKPGMLGIFLIFIRQMMFTGMFFFSYFISPRFCHKLVGYLQEQAFKSYSMMLQQIDQKDGVLNHWKGKPASQQAIDYYRFQYNATMRDQILAIRADELCHQQSNHFFAEVDKNTDLEQEKVRIYHDKNEARLKNSL